MDSEFLNDLFLEESNFHCPNNLSSPAAKAYDSFGPNRNWYHYNEHVCMTAREDDLLISSLSWKESILSSDVDPAMSAGGPLFTTE